MAQIVGGSKVRAQELPVQLSSAAINASIAAAGTHTFEVGPNKPMRVDRVLLDASTHLGLVVTSMLIGDEQLISGGGQVPAKAFAHDAVGLALRSKNLITSKTPLKVTVVNLSASAITMVGITVAGPQLEATI